MHRITIILSTKIHTIKLSIKATYKILLPENITQDQEEMLNDFSWVSAHLESI